MSCEGGPDNIDGIAMGIFVSKGTIPGALEGFGPLLPRRLRQYRKRMAPTIRNKTTDAPKAPPAIAPTEVFECMGVPVAVDDNEVGLDGESRL